MDRQETQGRRADSYIVEQHWPDFRPEHLDEVLTWRKEQDQTLGG